MEDTLEQPKCNACGSHVVSVHCDGAQACPWVRCANCGCISDTKSDNYMKDRQ